MNTGAIMEIPSPNSGLSKEQKTGFVLLLIFAIIIVSLGMLQIRNNIYSPFVIHLGTPGTTEENLLQDETVRLQSIDTDHDGINDYEELNTYLTSPYLPDTDSDGMDDKTEIEKGENPLCTKGELCDLGDSVPILEVEPMLSPILKQSGAYDSDALGMSQEFGLSSADLEEVGSMLKDPAILREIFLSGGQISAEDLSKIDDETLIKLVDDMLKKQGGLANSLDLSQNDTAGSETETE